jgi:hypothetical protein
MLCLGVFHGFSGVGYLSKVKGLLSNWALGCGWSVAGHERGWHGYGHDSNL